jgi:RHS repeat-associated protein
LWYDNANRRASLTYPNGASTSYGYDVASRLTSITHLGPGAIIEALTYQYDAAGNRTSLTRNNGTASLLPTAVASASYDAANEQTAFGAATLSYDMNGSLISDGVNTYAWDVRNRLVSISGGITASFNYDALGRRTSKVVNSGSSQFLYDGKEIAAEIAGGTVAASYLRSLSVDDRFIRQSSAGVEFYHTDQLGSSLALSNAQGASQVTYGYEPYGNVSVAGSSTNTFQFTGRENDGTSIYYYRARYYHPRLQRFIAEDLLGLGGNDVNFYTYVGNNPVRSIDQMYIMI